MSRRDKLVSGYLYPSQQAVTKTVAQWQDLMRAELARGGFRRYERTVGETYIHAAPPSPRILAEIYGDIPIPQGEADA